MRRQMLGFAATAILALISLAIAVLQWSALGPWAYLLAGGALGGAAVLAWAYLVRDENDEQSESVEAIQEELLAQQKRLDQREQALADRLAVFHEWMEFPQPINLASSPTDEELSQLAEKDRQLNTLLAETSEQLFRDIQENKYAPAGKFDLSILRDDAVTLARKVARIYSGDENPSLLDANLEDMLRASGRACLQMLTVLDQLPLDIRKHTFDNVYAYVRRAVAAYGVYRKAEPYFGYVSGAYAIGRLAMGANPVSMGAWWLAGQVGKRATRDFTTRFVNRQAMALLHEAIRVVGYEVANLYGAGFRYRDANWIYAAELTELLTHLPVSHRSLSQALQEVGALPLRSEFDRVFLYRVIAEGASARPGQYAAVSVLTPSERNAVASRLERFANAFAPAASPAKLTTWAESVGERLDVRIQIEGRVVADSEAAPIESARALMGLLVEIKQFEPEEAWDAFQASSSMKALSESQRDELKAEWDRNPAYFFELPDLAPEGPAAASFFEEATRLIIRHPPRGPAAQHLIESVAVYLRTPEKKAAETVVQACRERIAELWSLDVKMGLDACLTALDAYDSDGPPPELLCELLGGKVGENDKWTPQPLLFSLAGDRAAAFALEPNAVKVWEGSRGDLDVVKGRYLSGDLLVDGGYWLVDESREQARFRIRHSRFSLRRSTDVHRELKEWRMRAEQK